MVIRQILLLADLRMRTGLELNPWIIMVVFGLLVRFLRGMVMSGSLVICMLAHMFILKDDYKVISMSKE